MTTYHLVVNNMNLYSINPNSRDFFNPNLSSWSKLTPKFFTFVEEAPYKNELDFQGMLGRYQLLTAACSMKLQGFLCHLIPNWTGWHGPK